MFYENENFHWKKMSLNKYLEELVEKDVIICEVFEYQ